MSNSTDPRDEELIARLKAGLENSDPVPSDVTDFAKAALGWRDADAELAEIAFDSTEEGAMAAVRSSATARMISFEAGRWTIDIEYDESSRQLLGQVDPAGAVSIEIRYAGGVMTTESDDMGRFDFDEIPRGPMSLVVRVSGDLEVIKTEWTVL